MSARLRWLAVPAAVWLLAGAAPEASTVLQLNLGQMVERADRIGKSQSLNVVRDHTACSSLFRMAIMPARIRVLTVPSGSPKRCASSR